MDEKGGNEGGRTVVPSDSKAEYTPLLEQCQKSTMAFGTVSHVFTSMSSIAISISTPGMSSRMSDRMSWLGASGRVLLH